MAIDKEELEKTLNNVAFQFKIQEQKKNDKEIQEALKKKITREEFKEKEHFKKIFKTYKRYCEYVEMNEKYRDRREN